VCLDIADVVRETPTILPKEIEDLRESASRQGRHVQWESVPPEEESGTFVAWVASAEETKRMKPTDQTILGMVSESPGRNVREPSGGLDKIKSGGRALCASGRTIWTARWWKKKFITTRVQRLPSSPRAPNSNA